MTQTKLITSGIVVVAGVGIVLALLTGFVGKNNYQNYQVKQALNGKVSIQSVSGLYLKLWANMYTVPKAIQCHFSSELTEGEKVDDSIRVTFNDGGTAQLNAMIRIQTAIQTDKRLKTHEDFASDPETIKKAVHAHLVNICKATAPCMSASQHQSARKSEFNNLVNEQLTKGLYKMRKVDTQVKDPTDIDGKTITVSKTEVVLDADGMPIIVQESPLVNYGFVVQQFSITKTQYDPQTLKQFATKKESYLQTESSKAEREREVQQRLMVIEKGLREKAEVTATSNVEREKAIITAEKEKEMAEIAAAMKVTVAEQDKLEAMKVKEKALIVASQAQEVAVIALEAARAEAEAIVLLATAKEKQIALAGMITEREKVLATISADRDARVAKELAQVNVPSTMIIGGGQGGSSTDVTTHLINLKLLEGAGMLDNGKDTIGKAVGRAVDTVVKK